MGQDISLSKGFPDATIIYNNTQPTIDIMNKVLDFILKNADYRDMIALANQEECKKWIIIAEDKLTQLFQRIKVQPELGKKGVLYLKKIDTLKENNDLLGCKLLAVFFIRLFQVVGALSLSIMDTKIPDRRNYLTSSEEKVTERRGVPFFKSLNNKEEKKLFGFFGGEIEEKDLGAVPSIFHIFRRYFSLTATSNKYALSTIPTSRTASLNVPGFIISFKSDKIVVRCEQGTNSTDFDISLRGSQIIVDVLKRNEKDYAYNDIFSYAVQSDSTVKVTFDKKDYDFADYLVALRNKIFSLPPSQTIKILNDFNYLESSRVWPRYQEIKNIDFGSNNDGIFVSEKDMYNESPRFVFGYPIDKDINLLVSFNLLITKTFEKSIDTYTVEIANLKNETSSKKLVFEPDLNYEKKEEDLEESLDTKKPHVRKFTIKSGSRVPTNNRTEIPKYLQNMFEIIKDQALNALELGPLKSKTGYLNPVDNSKVTSKLKTRELWLNLVKTPPVKSFCTARALELLNISGLQKNLPEKIYPLIFNTSFDLLKDGSLPKPSQPITSAHGIKALESLYDNFDEFYGEKYYNSEKSKLSLGKMIVGFLNEEKTLSSLVEIIEKDGSKVEPIIVKDEKQKVNLLRIQAQKLFQTQFDHTKKVNTLLQKLFVFSEPITLNPSILAKGIRGIEEVATEARTLLSDYYSSCQVEYNKGVKILSAPETTFAPKPPV